MLNAIWSLTEHVSSPTDTDTTTVVEVYGSLTANEQHESTVIGSVSPWPLHIWVYDSGITVVRIVRVDLSGIVVEGIDAGLNATRGGILLRSPLVTLCTLGLLVNNSTELYPVAS